MRKLYKTTIKTAALMAIAFMANVAAGQNLKVTANGKPVSNGDVIEVQCEFEDYTPDFGFFFVSYVWNPQLEASIAEGTTTLNATLSKVDDLTPFDICWPANCIMYEPDGTASTSGKIGTEPSHIDIHIREDVSDENDTALAGGMSKVRLKADSETLEFTLIGMPADINGVGENLADDKSPIEYYSIQGVKVAEPQKGQLVIERKGGKVTKRIF